MVFREISDMKGVSIGGVNLRYADDTVLCAEDEADLQHVLDIVKVKSEEFGLSMNNVKKSKSMIFSRTENNKPRICLKLDGHIIEQVSDYIYLGQNITEDARCEAEIKRRIEIARNTFLAMKGLFTNRKVKFALRLRLINCYVWSVLLYGTETWTINKAMENRITSFEMWIYRRIMKISWKRMKTNKEILHMVGRKQIALVGLVKERKSNTLVTLKGTKAS